MTRKNPTRLPRLASRGRASLALLMAAAALATLLACRPAAPERPPNILLLTIDTLRADHLSSYGYPRQTSPTIDRLAAEGIRFERPVVQWPKTGPSFASIFTATYPKDNGIVRKVGIPLPQEFLMLSEVLRDRGYSTHAVVANGAVGSDFHFDQGFETYIETWKLKVEKGVDPTAAETVTRQAQGVLASLDRDRPYFFWVHYLDPHFPYTPPEPWSDLFQGDEHFDPSVKIAIARDKERKQMMGIGAGQVLDGRDELAFYIARYDAEIAYADAQIALLLESLREAGLDENTLIVITSDHGESLGDHHYFFDHGRFGFQTCLRVPLILHFPGRLEPRVETEPVELIHLTPTLLELAGAPLEEGRWMQGRSLLPQLLATARPASEPTYAFSEAGYHTERNWQKIVQDRRFKLVLARSGAEQRWLAGPGEPIALYDLESDPGETISVTDEHPGEARRLKRKLDELWDQPPFEARIQQVEPGEEREMDEETREQLKALGYLN